MPPGKGGIKRGRCYLLLFSHFWFATPQEVLQADWQEVWHSPQPPVWTLRQSAGAYVTCLYDNTVCPRCQASSPKAGGPASTVWTPSSRARASR